MIRVSLDDFHKFTDPGQDTANPAFAAEARDDNDVRCFKIPLEYNDPLSQDPTEERVMNIFMAVVCEEVAWLVVDSAERCDTKVHIVSRAREWTEEDLKTGSQVTSLLASAI